MATPLNPTNYLSIIPGLQQIPTITKVPGVSSGHGANGARICKGDDKYYSLFRYFISNPVGQNDTKVTDLFPGTNEPGIFSKDGIIDTWGIRNIIYGINELKEGNVAILLTQNLMDRRAGIAEDNYEYVMNQFIERLQDDYLNFIPGDSTAKPPVPDSFEVKANLPDPIISPASRQLIVDFAQTYAGVAGPDTRVKQAKEFGAWIKDRGYRKEDDIRNILSSSKGANGNGGGKSFSTKLLHLTIGAGVGAVVTSIALGGAIPLSVAAIPGIVIGGGLGTETGRGFLKDAAKQVAFTVLKVAAVVGIGYAGVSYFTAPAATKPVDPPTPTPVQKAEAQKPAAKQNQNTPPAKPNAPQKPKVRTDPVTKGRDLSLNNLGTEDELKVSVASGENTKWSKVAQEQQSKKGTTAPKQSENFVARLEESQITTTTQPYKI